MSKKKVLLIDDDVQICRYLKLGIEDTGLYNVVTENKASEALATARMVKPDIIFLDIMMPELLGPDVAAQIKAVPALANIPIVFLTGNVTEEEVRDHQGFIGSYPFLAKPTTIKQVVDAIKQQIG